MRFLTFLSVLIPTVLAWVANPATAAPIGADVRQLLVSIAPDWNTNTGKMIALERNGKGEWVTARKPVSVLFGKNGLAWGRGVLGTGEQGLEKVEGDSRAPAGVFRIGKVYTHDEKLPSGSKLSHHTISEADAWIDDPTLPDYNRHVVVDPKNPPAWFEKEKMRHNDFAYRWLVEIRHNADPAPVPGKGSAIFFHIRRGPTRPTAGCTTMAEKDLVSTMRWLDPAKNPHYALLPWGEYQKKWASWGLPNPALLSKIAP